MTRKRTEASSRILAAYFNTEKISAQLLKNPDEVVTGTVKELAEKYHVDLMINGRIC